MSIYAPFQGNNGQNQVVTPAGLTDEVNVAAVNKSVRLVNVGANICHVRIGQGTQAATTADTPIQSGESLVVQKAGGDDTVAYISSVGTTLHIQPGEGGY
jgi:hypothetical protein